VNDELSAKERLGMYGLSDPVASVLASARALQNFKKLVIEEMRNRKFDE
jgi:hypothetical protein